MTEAGGMVQAIEHLPGKLEALSSNPSAAKKENDAGQPMVEAKQK
jgi:hypothetical protein